MSDFSILTPNAVLDVAEEALGCKCTGYYSQLNSYINRVYEVETNDSKRFILKFYRPDRWTIDTILEEHHFVQELYDHDLPVVPPLLLHGTDKTLGNFKGIPYAIFQKRAGRYLDEYSLDQWQQLGHLIGRMHLVSAGSETLNRNVLTPQSATKSQVEFLVKGGFIPPELCSQFSTACQSLIDLITPKFKEISLIRLHGDCHWGNILNRGEESFLLFDFDDMVMGPAVQDFWMLLPGYRQDSLPEIASFLEGYEDFRPFNRRELTLIEPLRGMRFIHYIAWCAHQQNDAQADPGWGSFAFWQQEIHDLEQQIRQIELEEPFAESSYKYM
ncbi:MAG: serine/threonine protein kinase [Desulfobulbaceae bacterium]|jgi:Ser/Thr protein kinase RdoA (MazF antagonist)|nr:serine/threonine protein kinase [Desulfobulbaceae bacterium]